MVCEAGGWLSVLCLWKAASTCAHSAVVRGEGYACIVVFGSMRSWACDKLVFSH
jgi:hypothetical protein